MTKNRYLTKEQAFEILTGLVGEEVVKECTYAEICFTDHIALVSHRNLHTSNSITDDAILKAALKGVYFVTDEIAKRVIDQRLETNESATTRSFLRKCILKHMDDIDLKPISQSSVKHHHSYIRVASDASGNVMAITSTDLMYLNALSKLSADTFKNKEEGIKLKENSLITNEVKSVLDALAFELRIGTPVYFVDNSNIYNDLVHAELLNHAPAMELLRYLNARAECLKINTNGAYINDTSNGDAWTRENTFSIGSVSFIHSSDLEDNRIASAISCVIPKAVGGHGTIPYVSFSKKMHVLGLRVDYKTGRLERSYETRGILPITSDVFNCNEIEEESIPKHILALAVVGEKEGVCIPYEHISKIYSIKSVLSLYDIDVYVTKDGKEITKIE